MYTIRLVRSAAKALAVLPKPVQRRIGRRIDALAEDPFSQDSVLLRGTEDLRRVRVGDYRIIYRVEQAELLVLILRIRHRGAAYRNL